MTLRNTFDIAALPGLTDLTASPPMTTAQFLERLELRGPRALAEAMFLLDDLLQREAFLSGEVEEVDPVVLTAAQARNEAPLPQYLVVQVEESSRRLGVDRLWERAYRRAADVADEHGNRFLRSWVGHEIALRNALSAARAKRLGITEGEFLVAEDLAEPESDCAAVLAEWSAAATPLAGLQVLLNARWQWVAEHDAWFSFSDDELVAYAAKLMLVHQYRRVSDEVKSKK